MNDGPFMLPPIGNPELDMVPGMSAPIPADASPPVVTVASMPDTGGPGPVAIQEPAHWRYDFDAQGNSRATYPTAPNTGGPGDDPDVIVGSIQIGTAPENTLIIEPGLTPTDPATLATSGTGGMAYTIKGPLPAAPFILQIASGTNPPAVVAPAALPNWTTLEMTSNGNNLVLNMDAFGGSPIFSGRAAGGLSPGSGTTNNRLMLGLRAYGFGTTFSANPRAEINMVTSEAYSDAAQGARIEFKTAPIGSAGTTSTIERMRITDAGNLLIATTTDDGVSKLQVQGQMKATSAADPGGVHIVATGSNWPAIDMNTTQASGTAAGYIQANRNGLARWSMLFGNTAPESGGNAGSDFSITNWNDAGTPLQNPCFRITRATGNVMISGSMGFNGTAPVPKPNVTGAWLGNAAGKALCVALAATGLIIDSTTA